MENQPNLIISTQVKSLSLFLYIDAKLLKPWGQISC